MIPIDDYISLPLVDRQRHLDLTDPCLERGGPKNGGLSSCCKGLMAHILNTTIPTGVKILLCHACHNKLCSNPKHLYWGTPKENYNDTLSNGGKTLWEKVVGKYGYEGACLLGSKNSKGNTNGFSNKGKEKSLDHKLKISSSLKGHSGIGGKSNKGLVRLKVTCPYCSVMGAMNTMSRYHFENCKFKNII